MLAVIPVRDGDTPAGADETISECGGAAMLVGSRCTEVDLGGVARSALLLELGEFEPTRWSATIAQVIDHIEPRPAVDGIVFPASPDGRDLAPRLAQEMRRPLVAGAIEITPEHIDRAARGGLVLHRHRVDRPFVATLQPGVRSVDRLDVAVRVSRVEVPQDADSTGRNEARTVDVLPPDVRTMDLSEAKSIVGGGAGLDDEKRFSDLEEFASAIDAAMGATRVITDRGWVHHDKQIGTTGVVVSPDVYLSFGISGAVQHTAGLGDPAHIISVNIDPHCPMMAMSDIAIVGDANATLDELLALLQPARSGAECADA
jgi:electron transfer flavoprotein alpha subunit